MNPGLEQCRVFAEEVGEDGGIRAAVLRDEGGEVAVDDDRAVERIRTKLPQSRQ